MVHLRGLWCIVQMCSYYAKHNVEVQPENILVTTGASEATKTLDCITNEGDELLFQSPFTPIMTPLPFVWRSGCACFIHD